MTTALAPATVTPAQNIIIIITDYNVYNIIVIIYYDVQPDDDGFGAGDGHPRVKFYNHIKYFIII